VDIIKAWSPDKLDYDLVNGKPFIHARKNIMFDKTLNKLYEKGMRFMSGDQITHIPHLSNPPLDTSPIDHQNITMRLQARNVLVIFPDTYSLSDAVDVVNKWSPDKIDYDLVNGKPFIHARRNIPFATGVSRLYEKGVRFMTGNQITHIPHLSNPPLTPHNLDQTITQHVVTPSSTQSEIISSLENQVYVLKSSLADKLEEIKYLKKMLLIKDAEIDNLINVINSKDDLQILKTNN